jgi:glycosyltransferase involved in cell wall biosynthesis
MIGFEQRLGTNNRPRIALVHSFYSSRNPSGENAAVLQQADALGRAGYSVQMFAQRTDERELSKLYSVEAALTVATGRGPRPQMGAFAPDIIHIHNLFPNYGKTWIGKAAAPVVTTLHNYRPMCAAGTFFRDGAVCTDCLEMHSSKPALKHGCYRGRVQSVPVAIGQRFEKEPALGEADAVIVLSDQMRSLYAQAGVPDAKMHTLPHFLPTSLDPGPGIGGDYWLYAGRLSPEKGILQLVESWPSDRRLLIVGEGNQEVPVRSAAAGKNIELLGSVDRGQLLRLMQHAFGVVFPSRCFEGFGLVYLEALACGTPVLAWEPCVVSSFIAADGTGIVGGSAGIEESIRAADALFPSLRSHCRSVFEARYTESEWVPALGHVYASALACAV